MGYGDGCDWYEANDSPGCPNYGNDYDAGQGVAQDACCYCGGGNTGTSCSSFTRKNQCNNSEGCSWTKLPELGCFDALTTEELRIMMVKRSNAENVAVNGMVAVKNVLEDGINMSFSHFL